MRFWLVCVLLLVCLELSSVSAGGGRKAARLRRLKGRLDNLKKQVEKLRECVNNGKMNIYELREKLANLEKLCKQDQCACKHAGKCYAVGETYKQDCNTCRCGEGGLSACTKMACRPADCSQMVCTQQYEPVCGTDDITYSNECQLNSVAKCQNKSIEVLYNGPCGLH